jgi:hypothetical protein
MWLWGPFLAGWRIRSLIVVLFQTEGIEAWCHKVRIQCSLRRADPSAYHGEQMSALLQEVLDTTGRDGHLGKE